MTSNHNKTVDGKRGEIIAADLADLYDGVVDEYVNLFFNDMTDAPWLDSFAARIPSGGRVLDVGCGPGNFAAYLQNKGYQLIGIDVSPKMIAAAKELVPNGVFEVMNCAKLRYSDEMFEGVFAAYSLLHLTKEDAISSLREFHRTLVDGGILCLMLKEGAGEYNLPASLAPGKTCYVSLWSRQEVFDALTDAGFEVVHTDVGSPTSDKELQFQKLLFVAKKIPVQSPICRRMEARDVPIMVQLAKSADEIQTGTAVHQFWSDDILVQWANSNVDVLLVCEIAGSIAGFIISSFNSISLDGYLNCLVVSPDKRRSGVGAALLQETERLLAAQGCNHIFGLVKPTNSPSSALLRKCGFDKGDEFAYWQKSITPLR